MKQSLEEIVEYISKRVDCHVFPPSNPPSIAAEHQLPVDLQQFYHLCDGIDLFIDSPFPMSIVRSAEFRVANNVIYDDMNPSDLEDELIETFEKRGR